MLLGTTFDAAIVEGLFVAIISINVFESFVILVGSLITWVKPFSKSVDLIALLSEGFKKSTFKSPRRMASCEEISFNDSLNISSKLLWRYFELCGGLSSVVTKKVLWCCQNNFYSQFLWQYFRVFCFPNLYVWYSWLNLWRTKQLPLLYHLDDFVFQNYILVHDTIYHYLQQHIYEFQTMSICQWQYLCLCWYNNSSIAVKLCNKPLTFWCNRLIPFCLKKFPKASSLFLSSTFTTSTFTQSKSKIKNSSDMTALLTAINVKYGIKTRKYIFDMSNNNNNIMNINIKFDYQFVELW